MNTSTLRASPSNVTSAEYASSSELITDSTFDQSSTLTSSLPSLTDDDSLAASANHSDSQSDVINEKTDSLGSANSPVMSLQITSLVASKLNFSTSSTRSHCYYNDLRCIVYQGTYIRTFYRIRPDKYISK